jgi:hypothetical protein
VRTGAARWHHQQTDLQPIRRTPDGTAFQALLTASAMAAVTFLVFRRSVLETVFAGGAATTAAGYFFAI